MPPDPSPSSDSPGGSSVLAYLKHAFLFHWNLLFFLGATALALLSPWPGALLPIVGSLELAYLTGLLAMPRFRTAIDAKLAAEVRERSSARAVDPRAQQSLQRIIESLPAPALQRFALLRERCFEMREIASGVQGRAAGPADSPESIRTPALDRLLFLFLKLLMSQDGLNRFLKSTSAKDLGARVEEVRSRLAAAQAAKDDRAVHSLQDSLADAQLRLENYNKSIKDAEFVALELDRIETKIQALTEMAVSRQDPDTISHQVSAAAESMQHTEEAVNQLQTLSGLADQLADPPAILEADLGKMVQRVR
jgi:hypothetical protein